jgi:hypothetical protein
MGNVIFAGNGLVMRSSSDKPFTVSYAVVSGAVSICLDDVHHTIR